jgi:dipeptidyl aminopeptidase/acylaminoacyl peptidase
MNENRLKALLRETPLPGEEAAELRGLRVINEAFAERKQPRQQVLPRLALAFAIGLLLAALALTPAGAKVRDWIDEVFTAGVPNAERALTDVPGGGRLLVQSPRGPWVVQPDGTRRLLGRYDSATWSPHGLFVAAASGQTLTTVEPGGDPHWSVSTAGTVADPRWSPSGFRIAYRAGRSLRAAVADGTADALIDPRVAPVPPAWFPPGLHLLAYVDADGRLRLVNTDTKETMGSAVAPPDIAGLSWAADGSALLEAAPHALSLLHVSVGKLAARLLLGPAIRLPLPHGARVRSAAFSPRGRTIAALLRLPRQAGSQRSEVVLIDPASDSLRRLFGVSGRLSDLAWSPDGKRLLLAWPDADQWLFVPVRGDRRIQAVAGISTAFSPGKPAAARFPAIDGWCCAPGPGGAG